MTGYKFNTEQEAQSAVSQCDANFGYPKEGCVTQHWCEYANSELDGFFYIAYDETLNAVLGEPVEFEISMPENIQ